MAGGLLVDGLLVDRPADGLLVGVRLGAGAVPSVAVAGARDGAAAITPWGCPATVVAFLVMVAEWRIAAPAPLIAATTARRVLSGNAGSMLAEAVDALAHKANEAFGTTSPHAHAA